MNPAQALHLLAEIEAEVESGKVTALGIVVVRNESPHVGASYVSHGVYAKLQLLGAVECLRDTILKGEEAIEG